MSFVFSSLGCRLTAACISALMLSGCSGSDRVPFADVGGPRAGDPLIGKVDQTRDGRVLIGRVGDPQAEAAAYAPPTSPANGGSAGIDYLDTSDPSQSDGVQTAPMMAAAEPRSMAGGQEPAVSAMASSMRMCASMPCASIASAQRSAISASRATASITHDGSGESVETGCI